MLLQKVDMAETEARVWLRQVVEVFRTGCTLTKTPIDEKVCDMVLAAIDQDLIWNVIWNMLDGVLDPDIEPIGSSPAVVGACQAVGLPLLTIIAIIKTIIDLFRMFTNK
jgi:hypothetical protein